MSELEICNICTDQNRDGNIICVVEEPQDIYSLKELTHLKGNIMC